MEGSGSKIYQPGFEPSTASAGSPADLLIYLCPPRALLPLAASPIPRVSSLPRVSPSPCAPFLFHLRLALLPVLFLVLLLGFLLVYLVQVLRSPARSSSRANLRCLLRVQCLTICGGSLAFRKIRKTDLQGEDGAP